MGTTPKEDTAARVSDASVDGYYGEAERPSAGSFAVLIAIFNSLLAGGLFLAKRRGRGLPNKVAAGDIALIGVASHKLSRLITKGKVTSPLRAPFTELKGNGGPAELEETSRGRGARKALGDLLTCPYCLDVWVVTAFSIGLLFSPPVTRLIAAVLSSLTISDFLQIAYTTAQRRGLN